MKKLNINESVWVKLTEEGTRNLKLHYDKIKEGLPPRAKLAYKPPKRKTDEEGYTEFQLWELANIFGEQMYNGNQNQSIESTIKIDEKSLGEETESGFSKVFPYPIGTYVQTETSSGTHVDQICEYIVDDEGVSVILILEALKKTRRLSNRISIDRLLEKWTLYNRTKTDGQYTKK